MDRLYFNPGCALSLYKPEVEARLLAYLNRVCGRPVALHKTCCRHDPKVEAGSTIINVCAGCDRRFRSLYPGVSTVSLWEVIDSKGGFDFPDYQGLEMSVHDACPVRDRPAVHSAVRALLGRMNIKVAETEHHGTRSVCCGDDFYPSLPLEQVHERMRARAAAMPCRDVVVYCVSCVKAMDIGGKRPRHLVDLLLGEATTPQPSDTVAWHAHLDAYIETH